MTYYTFSISFDQAKACVRVNETTSLFQLAEILLETIGFELDHAFGFHSNLTNPYSKNETKEFTLFADQGDAKISSDTGVQKTKVKAVFSEKETMLFHFDYGDDWMFHVTCEAIEITKNSNHEPEILEVIGEFPEQYPPYDEDDDLEDHNDDAQQEQMSKMNEELLCKFAEHLADKKLSKKTINKHCSNITFYGNDYLLNYEAVTLKDGALSVDQFLGYWFILKCMWATQNSMKECITSFKKFYTWMYETGEIHQLIYNEFLAIIKKGKNEWLETLRKYEDPNADIEDIFF